MFYFKTPIVPEFVNSTKSNGSHKTKSHEIIYSGSSPELKVKVFAKNSLFFFKLFLLIKRFML